MRNILHKFNMNLDSMNNVRERVLYRIGHAIGKGGKVSGFCNLFTGESVYRLCLSSVSMEPNKSSQDMGLSLLRRRNGKP